MLGQWRSRMALRSCLWLSTGGQGAAWVGLGLKGNTGEEMLTSSTREVNQKPQRSWSTFQVPSAPHPACPPSQSSYFLLQDLTSESFWLPPSMPARSSPQVPCPGLPSSLSSTIYTTTDLWTSARTCLAYFPNAQVLHVPHQNLPPTGSTPALQAWYKRHILYTSPLSTDFIPLKPFSNLLAQPSPTTTLLSQPALTISDLELTKEIHGPSSRSKTTSNVKQHAHAFSPEPASPVKMFTNENAHMNVRTQNLKEQS